MPIPDTLLDAEFNMVCTQCGHSFVRKGSWVKTVRGFTCAECRTFVPLTYKAKVAIFAAREAEDETSGQRARRG